MLTTEVASQVESNLVWDRVRLSFRSTNNFAICKPEKKELKWIANWLPSAYTTIGRYMAVAAYSER